MQNQPGVRPEFLHRQKSMLLTTEMHVNKFKTGLPVKNYFWDRRLAFTYFFIETDVMGVYKDGHM